MKAPKVPKKTKGKKGKKKGGIKSLFVLHVEKAVLAIAVVVFLALVVRGMSGYEPLSWQPSSLTQAADQADTHIKSIALEPTEYEEKLRVTAYEQKADWIKRPLESRFYTTPTKWEPTLFPDLVPRGEPTVLAVRQLRAESGWGAVTVKDDNPRAQRSRQGATGAMNMGMGMDDGGYGGSTSSTGTKLEGRRWVVLTGLIPIKEQLKIYIDTYADAVVRDQMRDTPIYVGSYIERCEYDPTPGAKQVWKTLNSGFAFNTEAAKWVGSGPEQVDPSYIPPSPSIAGMLPAACPLPPLAQKMFGEEVAYPPYIPLLSDSLVESLEQQHDVLERLKETKPMTTEEMLELLNKSITSGSSGTMGGMYGGGGGGMDTMGGGGASGGYGSSPSGGMGTMGGRGMGMGRGMGGTMGLMTAPKLRFTPPSTIDYYLYRYFDFDVEEGKSYQYRVQLLLQNPNIGIDPKYIEDPDMSSKAALVAERSAPSAPVAVGRLSRILTKGVAAPKRNPWDEPTTSVKTIHFEIDEAKEWASTNDRSLRPGEIANFTNISSFAPEISRTRGGTSGGMDSMSVSPGSTTGRGAAAAKAPATKSFNIVSDVTFVDAYGGFPLDSGSEVSPGKALFMEPNGTLTLRDTTRDFDEAQKYDKPPASPRRPTSGASRPR